MKNKKLIIFTIIVFIIGATAGTLFNKKSNNKRVVSGYSFEISKKNIINKKLDGKYLDSFVTIVKPQDQFVINLEGIDSNSEVFIIDPTDGEMTPIENNNGIFTAETKLNKDINYGIIMNYNLVGSIRVVEDIKSFDEDKLFTEILIGLGCGI